MRARVTMVLLGAVSVLLAAETAQAQIVFMGRPGGWSFGGPRIQPISFGGFPAYSTGFAPWGYGYGAPWGYGAGAPWGGYNPYAVPWGYGGQPYTWSASPTYMPGWVGSSSVTSPQTRPTLHPALAVPPERIRAALYRPEPSNTATMELQLPAENAEVWFDDVKMTQTGRIRQFVTPALESGSYEYAVRVRWNDAGTMRELRRAVTVQPGDHVRLDFTRPAL
jgi:uncharacterized protein (TIGR03000 family)